MESSINLGIAVLAEGQVAKEAVRLGRLIADSVETVMGGGHPSPYITLVQGKFPRRNLGRIRDAFRHGVSSQLNFLLSSELCLHPNGDVFWVAIKSPALQGQHEVFSRCFCPLAEGMLLEESQVLDSNPNLSPGNRRILSKYGMLLAGPNFFPHIILARVKRPEYWREVVQSLKATDMSFRTSKFILGKINQYGQMVETIDTKTLD